MKNRNQALKAAMVAIISTALLVVMTGCADTVSFAEATSKDPVGFWYGLWHGMIFPLAWVVSLFSESTAVYAIYNNGGWYDFGFFLGVGGFSATLFSSSSD